jgi:hypothetical protein
VVIERAAPVAGERVVDVVSVREPSTRPYALQ